MARHVAGIRPAVISADSAQTLDQLRRFRRLVRNVYASHLVPDRMVDLVKALDVHWPALLEELLAFAEFLERAAQEDTEGA